MDQDLDLAVGNSSLVPCHVIGSHACSLSRPNQETAVQICRDLAGPYWAQRVGNVHETLGACILQVILVLLVVFRPNIDQFLGA